MQITQSMLDVCEEALYHLRQDTTLPTLAEAATCTDMEWVKCRKAFGYAANEVLAAHDWKFARTDATAKEKVDDWPENLKKVLVYCLARELAVQIAGRTEDLKNLHQLYNRFLFEAKLKDLEEDASADAVAKEVVSTLRGYFSDESKDIPRSMVSIYTRLEAVRDPAFREVLASHGWTNKSSIAKGEQLPAVARAAWILLLCQKLAIGCGLPADAVSQLGELYRQTLAEARVVELEAETASDSVVKEVVSAVRPFLSTDQKNLPRKMADLYDRIAAVKDAAFQEVKAAHEWQGKTAMTTPENLPPIARAAWITLLEIKAAAGCGISPEVTQTWQDVYLRKLFQARVVDLETSPVTDAVTKAVLAEMRPYYAVDRKDLPPGVASLVDRIAAVKDDAMSEVMASHGWTKTESDPLVKAAHVALVCAKVAVGCGLGAEAVEKYENAYLVKLNRAKVADLETTVASDAVAKEVLAAIRPHYSIDQKNMPWKMADLYSRVAAVKDAALKEVAGAHDWGTTVTSGDNLPPLARAAWIVLMEVKLAIGCGLSPELIATWQGVYAAKIAEARVAALESCVSTDAFAKEVLAEVRPFFSTDQKNLPRSGAALVERIVAVKDAAFREVKAAHGWQNLASIATADQLPALARSAYLTLVCAKVAVGCGLGAEAVEKFENAYLVALNRAKVADLETTVATDAVAAEVLAAVRPFFSFDQKNLPWKMADLYSRVTAVKDAALKEVAGAHDWGTTITSGDQLPPLARAAWIALMELKLAVACGLSAELIATWQGVYQAKILEARVANLEAYVSTDAVAKEVLAAVRPFFSPDQKNLPRSGAALVARVTAVKDAAFEEVKAAHGWQNLASILAADQLPALARAAYVALIEAKVAVGCGLGVEAAAKLEDVYLVKLNRARVADLETTVATDPVVAEVLSGIRPYFAFDAKTLPMKMKDVYDRVDAVRQSAYREILAAHDWQGKASITKGEELPALARAAWIALVQQKLCIACGLSPEAAASFETIWRTKLKEARVADLETTSVPAGLAGEVLTLIRDSFDASETNLPMNLQTLADRIVRMKPIAMREVLSAHPWGFAMEELATDSGTLDQPGLGGYVNYVPVPDDCVKVVGVFGRDGELLKWQRVNGEIRSDGRIKRLTYVKDVEDLADFSPDGYRLVVLRLAADMSRAMSVRSSLQNLHENIYRDALAEAKARDARESNPSAESVWGANTYADIMRGE